MVVEVNLVYWITVILNVILVLILSSLFRIYLNSYKKIKVHYTMGLVLFSLIFLIYSLGSLDVTLLLLIYPIAHFQQYLNFTLVQTIVQVIAMGILFKVTKDE